MAKKKKAPESHAGQLDMLEELGQKIDVNYTEEQETFIFYDGLLSVILAATAGSGKTFSCVQRLKSIVEKGVDPNKIIFFSFTKAATEELREYDELKDALDHEALVNEVTIVYEAVMEFNAQLAVMEHDDVSKTVFPKPSVKNEPLV